MKAAETEAAAITEELDAPEREAMRRAFGEGSTGKGVAKAIRGSAGAMKDLEDRQKSRATRLKRDALDRALLDLAAFYRDVLAVQVGAEVELTSAGHERDVRKLAAAGRRRRRSAGSRPSWPAGSGWSSTSPRCWRSRR